MISPTLKTIKTMLKISEKKAKEIKSILLDVKTKNDVDAALNLINEMINGSGVEAIQAENVYVNKYYQNIVLLYVNKGDTYTPTIVFDRIATRFYACSWGAILEERCMGKKNPAKKTKGVVKLVLKKTPYESEWAVRVYINGKYNEKATHYSSGYDSKDTKEDAINTMKLMKKWYEKKGYSVE